MTNDVETTFLDMTEIAQKYNDAIKAGNIPTLMDTVDIIEFCESPKWGNFKLYPAQSMFFKIAYKLWEKYPFTDAENVLIQIENDKWGIDLLARCHDNLINHFMMIVGRRGLKSSTIAMIIAYEAYKLIVKEDPQQYYQLLDGTEIYITNAASNEEQAKTVYNLAYDRLKTIPFFTPYLDNSLDNSTEIALYTPRDIENNNEILRYNLGIPRGESHKKKRLQNGSIRIKSIPTSSAGARSRGSIVVIFDEFAHFERLKSKGKGDPRELLGGNKRTDEAMWRALVPSAATYGLDYKIFAITSPADQAGKCFSLYCSWKNQTNHYVQQFATWEVNPTVTRDHPEVIETEKEDPIGFKMEWAGEFVESIQQVLSDDAIILMIDESRVFTTNPVMGSSYIITLDPAKGSDPDSDTYAVAWGHVEQLPDDTHLYIVDGLRGFRSEVVQDPTTNEFITMPLDVAIVDEFVLQLAQSLRRVVGLFYDQYDSTHSIAKFRKIHLPAVETTYTTSYKRQMYSNFINKVNTGKVKVYGQANIGGEGGWELDTMTTELKYIQRVISGNSVSYKHPESGVVTTDDFADVVANLVYQLDRFATLGIDYMKSVAKASHGPITMGGGYKPVGTHGLGVSPFKQASNAAKQVNVANRVRGSRRF